MKYHVSIKFLAVLLCTLTLLASLLCILGIAVLEQQDLYDRDLEQVLQENLENALYSRARTLANIYTAEHLGGCDPLLIEAMIGRLSWDHAGLQPSKCAYTIRDSQGAVLESTLSNAANYVREYSRTMRIHHLIQLEEVEADYNGPANGDPVISPSVPTEDGAEDADSATEVQIWDPEQGRYRAFLFRDSEESADYQVTIHLEEGAYVQDPLVDWALLLWNQRNNLFFYLAGSLLIFAISAVYLCCAAGRRPGSEELCPGGFNAIPLDLYTVILLLLGFVAISVIRELGTYFDASYLVYGVFLLFAAFFGCLAFVGWCFAWAAQLKMGGGYWWRWSLAGILLLQIPKLLKFLWELAVILCTTVYEYGCAFFRGFWVLIRWAATGTWHCMQWLAEEVWVLLKKGYARLKRLLLALGQWLKALALWVFRIIHRFLSLLPLTWQWLLIGFVLMLMLYLCLRSYKTGWNLVGFGVFFAAILYGATAFGTLLEATREMGKGDLDAKVHDAFLLGAFKDFAGELNALAGVARVAAQKEMRSERMKSELITNVSHDIKTPLTSIINYVDLLQKPHTEEEGRQYLEVLDRQSQRLKKLIDDLMDMSKASTGNMAVEITTVDAVESVNQALGEFADKLDRSHLIPVFRHDDPQVPMRADGKLVWRVLSNLLGNAVKYAMPGTRLYIDLMALEGKVILSLKNISREELNVDAEELMERFVRGDDSRNTEGSGLGLNIAKSLMELQKGQLQLLVDGDLFKVTLIFPAE